jgi:transposase InsO family protein
MGKLGIKHIMTTAYHPQSNGMLERFHRRLKDALRAKTAVANWSSQLPLVMLGLRSAPREDSGISAAELVFSIANVAIFYYRNLTFLCFR